MRNEVDKNNTAVARMLVNLMLQISKDTIKKETKNIEK
tara:strand:+ start:101 stop:214 length:114 start_codon:yes stop_codon:yes gene_type:complete